ncbi:alpha/beta hydrolase [Haliea sp. E17]|uniref:alpha/beta hydrolase n=1 Tax=Haliea sp. E17 TaxID=3401576 RepID=UPI003AAD60F2
MIRTALNASNRDSLLLLIVLYFGSIAIAVDSARADVRTATLGHDAITIWPGAAPGTESWKGAEFSGKRSVTNVTVPTLTVFYPEPGHANGNAMVVCPGGGFTGLAMIEEGTMVAEWLAARGITAFVLKYRVRRDALSAEPASTPEGEDFDSRAKALEPGRKIALADAVQAMHYLRAKASDYNIDPRRIGMVGFSAGAMTTMGVVTEGDADAMPDVAASIYGAMPREAVPANAPPLFIVHAQDDTVVPPSKSVEMYTAWSLRDLPVELHIFASGGHGFGAVKHRQAADRWMALFGGWLDQQGWTETAPRPSE